MLTEPNHIRFVTGARRRQWHRNVIAIGLLGGFMEPLESTSIHLIQRAILRLIRMMPQGAISPREVAELNDQQFADMEQFRDFLTAIIASNDQMALATLKECRERGIAVPRDLSLISFDNTPIVRFTHPPLTAIDQPIAEIAARAAELIIADLAGEEASEQPMVVPAKLVLRQSTAQCQPASGSTPLPEPCTSAFGDDSQRALEASRRSALKVFARLYTSTGLVISIASRSATAPSST